MADPIVMVSSYPPRLCGIATFTEEAREFIQKKHPDREVLVISHTDGEGDGVLPIIDLSRRSWWRTVADTIRELSPYTVHIEHEYSLYNYVDNRGRADSNEGLLNLLEAIDDVPTIVEPHTVHGRLTDFEADFIFQMCERANVVVFKCHYQKWRLDWNFAHYGWPTPTNVMVIPYGARDDRRFSLAEVIELRDELGLNKVDHLSEHLVGLVGWIQSNKRWDILTSMWEDIAHEIQDRTGERWDLLAAGTWRDPRHKADYDRYRSEMELLEKKGLAHYYEFIPRGEVYYKMLAVCDFLVLPSTDETQSSTLARIIALNKPFVTTAPMEGLTAVTLESGGGLLFTTRDMLRDHVIELATNEQLRMQMGENLKRYLDTVVNWDIVTEQYDEAYDLAREAVKTGRKVDLPKEF
ncbi:MAG: glycosyltransferase [Planctomycetes bacterium]|nr:glycosyltransferase [Phycisphaerae bacterium]NBB95322.1 glycosyltransferase [Planctomycetota bacterium]